MLICIKVSSKDDKILSDFSKFLIKLELLPVTIKHFSKRKKKKFITILKSPHVNKTAQEQFEFRYYSKNFSLNSTKPLTTFIILKKLKALSFPGIHLRVKSVLNTVKEKNKDVLKVLDPDNVILNRSSSIISQKKCIQLFDCYGEACLKDLSYINKNIQHL